MLDVSPTLGFHSIIKIGLSAWAWKTVLGILLNENTKLQSYFDMKDYA